MPYRLCRTRLSIAAAVAVSIAIGGFASDPDADDPFQFLAPSVVVSAGDRARLDDDEVLARILPVKHGQLALFVATRLNAPPDALVSWTRAIAQLKQSKFVIATGRFSDPPKLSDLDRLTLDDVDLDAIRRCRPGACGMKLAAEEIESLTDVAARAGAGWQDALQREFRRLLIARVEQYRAGGLASLSPPADRLNQERPDEAFSALVEQSPYLKRLPSVLRWLREYPQSDSDIESFLYWSKEYYGGGKRVISVTHVGIVASELSHRVPAVLVVGKQIFATHYVESALGLTMVFRDDTSGSPYLAYVNRSQVDILRGFFGDLVRSVMEGRLEHEAPAIVRGLRQRLESGNPPDDDPDSIVPHASGVD